jgi:hypothetical protein
MSKLQQTLDARGFKNDLSYSYDPSKLTREELEIERRANQQVENAEKLGNLNGAPNLKLREEPSRKQRSSMAVANAMLGKAKHNHSRGTVNGFKSARNHLKLAEQAYLNAGERHKATMARTTLEKMDPMPAMNLLQQMEEESDPKRRRIMYGKLASVYRAYGMSEKASNALQKSVAGGRRRTKRSKKSNRKTRRH